MTCEVCGRSLVPAEAVEPSTFALRSRNDALRHVRARWDRGGASIVDHIKPHKGDQRLFWGPSNHQSLCQPHHYSTKQREELTGRVIPEVGGLCEICSAY